MTPKTSKFKLCVTIRQISGRRAFIFASSGLACLTAFGQIDPGTIDDLPGMRSADLQFSEPARGGTLELVHKGHDEHASIRITTTPGQAIKKIEAALRREILNFPLEKFTVSAELGRSEPEYYRSKWQSAPIVYVLGFPGEVILGGTETGLGILPPVGSLSARYDPVAKRHTFRWHEKSAYTSVHACGPGGGGPPVRGSRDFMNPEAFCSAPAGQMGRGVYRYTFIVGFKNGLPTNASHIFTSKIDQIEYFYHPFTNGIASNWTGWQGKGVPLAYSEQLYPDMEAIAKTQAARAGHTVAAISRCAQLMQSKKQDGRGGMYRFFIAQTPGQTYRSALRCHIMEETEDFEGEWSFEVMTGVVDPERAYEMDNATRIMINDAWAELEANGEQISKWRFDHTMPRTDEWIMNQSGAQDSDILQKDIVLGNSKTAVFFCVRLSGHKPNGIAMDGVRLVDVTDGFPNANIRDSVL